MHGWMDSNGLIDLLMDEREICVYEELEQWVGGCLEVLIWMKKLTCDASNVPPE